MNEIKQYVDQWRQFLNGRQIVCIFTHDHLDKILKFMASNPIRTSAEVVAVVIGGHGIAMHFNSERGMREILEDLNITVTKYVKPN